MTVLYFTDDPFVVPDQNFYTGDDDTSPKRMSIIPKAGKVNTQSGLANDCTTTLPASKRSLSQRDAALVEW